MSIPSWKGDPKTIDKTFGYKDFLLVPGTGHWQVDYNHNPARTDWSGAANPSHGVSDAEAASFMREIAQTDDQLFRLPNGGIFLRRNIFQSPCRNWAQPSNEMQISYETARAVAYFTGTTTPEATKKSVPHLEKDVPAPFWCRDDDPIMRANGLTVYVTPWNLSGGGLLSLIFLMRLRDALTAIRNAKDNPNSTSDRMARDLAAAVPSAELDHLSNAVNNKVGAAVPAIVGGALHFLGRFL